VEYILNNPVRKGIVQDWTQYPYKGAIGYNLEDVVAPFMGADSGRLAIASEAAPSTNADITLLAPHQLQALWLCELLYLCHSSGV
jgi:hypothetical protein